MYAVSSRTNPLRIFMSLPYLEVSINQSDYITTTKDGPKESVEFITRGPDLGDEFIFSLETISVLGMVANIFGGIWGNQRMKIDERRAEGG